MKTTTATTVNVTETKTNTPTGAGKRPRAGQQAGTNNQNGSNVIKAKFPPQTLDTAEACRRDECEIIIRCGWDTFLEVGRALLMIRDQRLYRDDFETFDDYCRGKWEFSKTHANRLIEAASVAAVLTPIGVKLTSESQLRPLARLTPQKIPAAWKKAQELAGEGEVTAKVVRQAAEEFRTDSPTVRRVKRTQEQPVDRHRSMRVTALKLLDNLEQAVGGEQSEEVATLLAKLRRCLLD